MATTHATLSEPMCTFLDEVMPAIVGTSRSDGSVQMNPAWFDRRDDEIWLNPTVSRAWGKRLDRGKRELSQRYLGRLYADHRPDDPRQIVRVRPVRITGSIDQAGA